MAAITAEVLAPIMSAIGEARGASRDQFRAGVVVQVATLRLLIDKQIITADAAIQQIEDVRRAFPQVFESEDVGVGIQWAIDLLRGETPLHGSFLDQQIQRDQRAGKLPQASVRPGALGQSQVGEPRRR